jgi:AmiR/NasT family two-component response regulator
MRVLIADDEAIIRIGLRTILIEAGHDVVGTATNGRAALALAQELRPDAVILDIKMPEMDGLTAARQIMDSQPTAIVLLTAYSDRALVEQARNAAVFAYLVKPVKEEMLGPTLELAAARFAEWKELRDEVASLQESFETRDRVEEAKRRLMQSDGINERQAYLKIQQAARARRVGMRKVADEILAGT